MPITNSIYTAVQQKEVKYTKGGEYSLEGDNYVGIYHISNDGVFTGEPNLLNKKALTKYYKSKDVYLYDKSFDFKKIESTYKTPTLVKIQPTENDYTYGYFKRYFIVDTTNLDMIPFAIDETQASQYGREGGIDAGKYTLVEILWKLTGSLRNTSVGGSILQGIYDHNKSEIDKIAQTYPNIVYSVTSYVEFAIPS
jgi:hypothetical protein